jgi:ATP synthase protein I
MSDEKRPDENLEKLSSLKQKIDKLENAEKKSDLAKDKNIGERVFAEIIAGLIFGVVFGQMTDNYFDTSPIFLLVFIILGLAASIYNVYKATKN